MSFLKKVARVHQHLPHGTAPGNKLMSVLVDKGERYGASFAFGAIKGYYRERAMVHGVPVDALAGAGGLVLSAVLQAMSNGNSKLAKHVERVADAGMQSYINSVATSWGTQKAGRSVMVLPGGHAGATKVKGLTALGLVPPQVSGAWLDANDMINYAKRR